MTAAARALGLGLALIALGLGGGCGDKKRTEVMLGVATDLDAPDPLTLVDLQVFKLPEEIPVAGQGLEISGNINTVYELPGTFGVYSASGAADRIRVKLTGTRRRPQGDTKLVVRTAVLNLVPGKTLFVRLGIVTACIGKLDCGDGLTCIDGECGSEEIDSSRLPDYHPGMEHEIACPGGTGYVDTSTKQPLTVTGTSCAAGETCMEGYCLAPAPADGGQDRGQAFDAGRDAADAGGDAGGGTGGTDAGSAPDAAGTGGAGGVAGPGTGGAVGPGTGGTAGSLFGAPVDYVAGTNPLAIGVADLTGDGKADLVATSSTSGTVGVFVNNGNGTFAAAVNYPTNSVPHAMAIGDLNADGRPDLAIGHDASVFVRVFLNNGDGTFGAGVDYPTSGGFQSAAIGDLDGDGVPIWSFATPAEE